MENARATAEHWRALARETQATAETVDDVRERLALLLIARVYEQLAKTADQIDRALEQERVPTSSSEPRVAAGAPLSGEHQSARDVLHRRTRSRRHRLVRRGTG
jgi:hypothetical protein